MASETALSEIERLATAVGLSARQRELLASLLAEEGIDLDGEPPITPLHGRGDLQLSSSQLSFWFLQQMAPESPFYNIAVAVRLGGALDIPILGRALAEVARRHETLRTTFVEAGGEPRVRVAPPQPVHLPLVDLSSLPAAAACRLAEELTLTEARRRFDLAAGPLLRVLLLKLDPREHKVVLTLHHVIADGWSLSVLVYEVGSLYGAFLRGVQSPLPELPFQYTDYVAWKRKWMQGAILERELAHWRAKLAGAEPVLALPFDHPRPAVRSDRGATRIFVLPAELTQSVERLGGREGTSLFMTLLGAFFALLGRYTGQRDLVVGYPVANRDRSDIEGMIGLFLNTLVLRVDLSGDPSFRTLLGRVRDEVLEAQSHAQLPFETLVKELRPDRSLGYNPLFQVMFVLQNTPPTDLVIPGLTIEAAILDLAIAQFDLTCRMERSGDTLLGRLEYSEDLFESATIERLSGHFVRLLAEAVADPQRSLSQLPMLAVGERHQLMAEPKVLPAERPGMGQEPRAGGLPLSFAQQRLWFLDQIEPGSPAYNIATEVELRGRLDVGVVAAAFGEVVRRHAALRTTFHAVAGEAVQGVAPPTGQDGPGLPVIDLRALPGRQRKQEVSRLKAAEARLTFDLARGPLLRTTLLRLGAMHHAILVTMHHIVSDGWSMGLVVREVATLYPALLAGAPSPLPELAMQYAGFAEWQRRHLSGDYLASEIAWWRRQLSGLPPALDLPADHPRPAASSGRGGDHIFMLKASVLAALKAFSVQHGATLFMTLLSGFLALLQRYTGEDDLAVGTPVAGRTRVELEPLIGLFVNTLVLRADLSGDPPVAALVDRVRETTLSAYSHQEVPFERLVEDLTRQRDLSRPPLVQVLFVVQNTPSGPLELPGLELKATFVPTATTKLDLTCNLTELERGLEATLEYSRDLFEPATMERLAEHFTRLLEAIVAAPQQRLSQLPLLSEAERGQLLGWNAAQPALHGETTLTALWSAAVSRSAESPALSFEDDTLSYGELNRHANRLAWRLRRLGVGPESRVGVLLDRSLEQVVALLGILKAGGAYVPLDPSAPEDRLAFLCADSGIEVLVTDGRDEMPRVASVVRLGKIEEELDDDLAPDDGDLPSLVAPDNLCYVIYTSGSTGRPKGVQVSHGSVARLLSATQRWFDFGAADVWTLFHSYSFDFSVWELWGALAYGGRLVVVPHWVSRSPEAFWWLLAEERVTVLNQTPSAFRQLIQADGEVTAAERSRLALRLVIFGGEALDLASLRLWYERHAAGAPLLVNMYGITETTVHVSYRPLAPGDLAGQHRSPIGEAIADLSLRVLSPQLELVPVGVPGEICVGGAGLARGYLERPELTAERFVPDPFSTAAGQRLYRSGDLARYRLAGDRVDLDYLGRRDSQVKVRGFRIELGEIEASLLAQPGVRAAAVLPRQDASGSTSLVAYVEAPGAAEGELRESLLARLPEYMVPSSFVVVESLPLTVNGKLDRQALSYLALEPAVAAEPVMEPRTETEKRVAGIFAEVLSLERVGPEADFFALGGHSLLATQVASRLRSAFGVEVVVRTVFEAPTVEALARRIEDLYKASECTMRRALGDTATGL